MRFRMRTEILGTKIQKKNDICKRYTNNFTKTLIFNQNAQFFTKKRARRLLFPLTL